jgi:hypothetical protein
LSRTGFKSPRCRLGRRPGLAPLLFAALSLLAAGVANAEDEQSTRFEIIPTVGYMSGDEIEVTGGVLKIDGSQSVGLVLDFDVWKGAALEISYTRKDAEVWFSDSTGTTGGKLFDAGLDYLQIRLILGAGRGRSVTFSSVSIGATHFNPKGVNVNGSWKMSVGVGVGTKVYFTERIGARLHGRLLPTFLPTGADIFCDDDQCYSKIESGAMLQWEVSVGVVIAI